MCKCLLSLLVLAPVLSAQAAKMPVGTPHVYKTVAGRELKLYVLSPKAGPGNQRRPAIVFFHGGGWVGGAPSQFNDMSEHFASRGMVAVQVEYRLLDKKKPDPPLVCVQDAKSAMRWVRAHAAELGIDPNRIASGGGSAGGHLAAFVGMVNGLDDPADDLSISPKSNAMLLFNPVFDNGPGGWGHERVGDRYREFSPFHNITSAAPPAIVFVGSQDKLLPSKTVLAFRDAMRKAGVRCEANIYEGQEHGFFNVANQDGRYFRETRDAADAFLVSLGWLKPARQQQRAAVKSFVTIYNVADGSKKVVYTAEGFYQAPNWSPDGKYLLLNTPGKLWRFSLDASKMEAVNTGSVKSINNDHGISKDGKWFAISGGQVYVLPSAGGEPRQVTNAIPSYFHGFSPDGRWLAYCAKRGDNFDIYRIAFEGGAEQRLTTNAGYDDGPEYSPDGKWIYFNSNRSGSWDIWRMPASGAGANDAKAERLTGDDYEDWFPHLSPDGKWIVFLSFEKGIPDHPANKNVVLRMMSAPGNKPGTPRIREVVKLFGGQGTMNVSSWSPDSTRFAYVSYELLKK